MTVSAGAVLETRPSDHKKNELLISADSHVFEPRDLWEKRLPAQLRDKLPPLPKRGNDQAGGTVPSERLGVMRRDGVSAEVLFPTFGLTHFALEDAELQEAAFRAYNDWLVEYCAATPGRLIGLASISTYDIDHAVQELERTQKLGLKGALLWLVPHPDLPYGGDHYERLWAAAQDMNAPVSMHILSGFSYNAKPRWTENPVESYRGSVGEKLNDAINLMFDFIFFGVLDRYPRLKLVLAETETGWMPWILQQWDYYARRFGKVNPLPGKLMPTEYFARQIYATFFNDPVGARNYLWWGIDNCMWSNDFPHGNTTWPNSRAVIERDLSILPEPTRAKLLRENVAKLFDLKMPEPIETAEAPA